VVLLISFYLQDRVQANAKKDKLFYEVDEINQQLLKINRIKNKVLKETENVYIKNNLWNEWVEKYLYDNSEPDGWKIFPFYAFGVWVDQNCKLCPTITKFLKSIKGLELATLSRLKPKTKLNPHEGWGSHSNHVIRCHYGLIVPDNECYVHVQEIGNETKNEFRYHEKFKWMCFDDSKTHYAENSSDSDRVVLIVDIIRPNNIQTGKSDVTDSKELLEIIDYFRKINV
jgi:aspartyl/asparaginyl beta-hydroxylase (cupin superfamily)